MRKMKCHTYVHIEAEAEFQPSFFLNFPFQSVLSVHSLALLFIMKSQFWRLERPERSCMEPFLRVCAMYMYTHAGCQYGGHMLTWGEFFPSTVQTPFQVVSLSDQSLYPLSHLTVLNCWSCKESSFICVSHLKARCFGFFFFFLCRSE